MSWDIKNIREVLGGKLIGSLYMQKMVCAAILKLPDPLKEHICKKVWFISSPQDAWAFTFKGSDIRERHLIFLSEELFRENQTQILFTILHEIGHVILNHRNSIGVEQTAAEIKKQEREADTFALTYTKTP